MSKISIITLLLLICPLLASAEIFKYTDSEGKTHFVSEQGQIPEQYRADAVDSSAMRPVSKMPAKQFYKAPANQLAAGAAQASKPSSSYRKVEIYVTTWCPYCRQLEDFLKQKKVPYVRYDVERSVYGKKFYASMGQGGIPITKIGNTIIRGLKRKEILQAAAS